MIHPFAMAFADRGPFGTLVGVHLPVGLDPVPGEALEELTPAERELALGLKGRRQIEWTGGRLALRRAAAELGLELGPVLRGARGEPLLPEGLSASISHKRRLAVALIAPSEGGTLGIDLEELGPERLSILGRILRPEEERLLRALPEAERWEPLLMRFVVKEAVYKALHPHVNRYVGFTEAAVEGEPGGPIRISLHLAEGEGPFEVEVHADRRDDFYLGQARMKVKQQG